MTRLHSCKSTNTAASILQRSCGFVCIRHTPHGIKRRRLSMPARNGIRIRNSKNAAAGSYYSARMDFCSTVSIRNFLKKRSWLLGDFFWGKTFPVKAFSIRNSMPLRASASTHAFLNGSLQKLPLRNIHQFGSTPPSITP